MLIQPYGNLVADSYFGVRGGARGCGLWENRLRTSQSFTKL